MILLVDHPHKHADFCYHVHMQMDGQGQANMVIGYGLVAVGVLIMLLSLFQVYRVFTKQAQVVQFFSFQGVKIDLGALAPQIDTSALDKVRTSLNLPPSTSSPSRSVAETEIIPAEVLNGPANLGVYMLFMGFVLNLGYKIADLGTKLVRPIYVKTGLT